MIQVGKSWRDTGNNAWGRATNTVRTRYELEEKDVGRTMENYGGFKHASHTITRGDVGKVIEFINEPGRPANHRGEAYECWYFIG